MNFQIKRSNLLSGDKFHVLPFLDSKRGYKNLQIESGKEAAIELCITTTSSNLAFSAG
jgi:hypothetical protein